MKNTLTLLLLILMISCKSEKKPTPNFKVEYKGALRNMMKKGDVSAKETLAIFKDKKHIYALGAIENLKGEIQIFDNNPFLTQVIDSALSFDYSLTKKATLLVYASVKKWKKITIPNTISTYKELEKYIAKTAKENQIKINEPFPFLLEGAPKSFDWHVINWKDGDTQHSHKKHINSGLHGTLINRKATFLGFYSDAHHAIFTHHTTNMHIHFLTDDKKIAGHVDGLILDKNMILKLPAVE